MQIVAAAKQRNGNVGIFPWQVLNGTLTGPTRIDPPDLEANDAYAAGLGKDDTGGVFAVWGYVTSQSTAGKYKPLGGAWGALEPIPTPSFAQDCQVTWINGRFWLTYDSSAKAYITTRSASGTWDASRPIHSAPERDSFWPRLAKYDAAGNVHVVYQSIRDGEQPDILVRIANQRAMEAIGQPYQRADTLFHHTRRNQVLV